MDDVTFHIERDDYSTIKGGSPIYRYLDNDSVDFAYVNNGEEIRDVSREYFIKIQELCEQEGIEFLLVKSPNHYRWDDEATQAVHEFAKERNVPLLDFHTYDDFITSDYSDTTGRLNIHGMKRFTEHLCDYLYRRCAGLYGGRSGKAPPPQVHPARERYTRYIHYTGLNQRK